jgi:hypothetical protein
MIYEILVKCVALIAVIQVLRILGQRIGPRSSGLLLGLPSSTAVLLVLCGLERGPNGAIDMADASILGLIAAISLPLAYAQAVRLRWGLTAALSGAVAAYVLVASTLGSLGPGDPVQQFGISVGSVLVATFMASRIGSPSVEARRSSPSARRTAVARTVIPTVYVVIVAILGSAAGPRWAGLAGTFPSVSTVVLAVTHLEEGAVSASRIARTLPSANLSTAAFLAAFRFGCPGLGLGWATICGYAAALVNLGWIELLPRFMRPGGPPETLRRTRRGAIALGMQAWRVLRDSIGLEVRPAPHDPGRLGIRHRRPFAPALEILPC